MKSKDDYINNIVNILHALESTQKIDELILKMQSNEIQLEFGKGGTNVSRGIYEYSLYDSLTVGGVSRGKIIKRITEKSKPTYIYYLYQGKLILIERLVEDGETYTIEIIQKGKQRETGIVYNIYGSLNEIIGMNIYLFNDENQYIYSERMERVGDKQFDKYQEYVIYEGKLPINIIYRKRIKLVSSRKQKALIEKLLNNKNIDNSKAIERMKKSKKRVVHILYNENKVPIQYYFNNNIEDIYELTKLEQQYYKENFF